MQEQAAGGSKGRRQPLVIAGLATLVLLVLIYIGSRGLRDFDAALIGYAVATIVAFAALVYRYSIWVTRPPTWRYFKGGWTSFLSWRNFRRYTLLVPMAWWTDILAQTFIFRRSPRRWLMHMAIFWGVILSLAITIPLSFGWIRFTLHPVDEYHLWVFGIRLFAFPLDGVFSFLIFHALDFSAALLLVGLGLAWWRRTREQGPLLTQRFGFDLMPLVLLAAIAVTGLALTASSALWEGRYYSFIAFTHQIIVVAWLLSLPFGKFFHIIERPATIGVRLYQRVTQDVPEGAISGSTALCRGCGEPLPSERFIADLKGILADLGQRYELEDDRGNLVDYCPSCKRCLRGTAYYQLMGKRFL
jgi:hypothetical protein